jgi:hypothetical protein
LVRAADLIQSRSKGMPNPIKHFVLTPKQAEEKALIVDQMRINPRGPWVNGKKTNLPKLKGTTLGFQKRT